MPKNACCGLSCCISSSPSCRRHRTVTLRSSVRMDATLALLVPLVPRDPTWPSDVARHAAAIHCGTRKAGTRSTMAELPVPQGEHEYVGQPDLDRGQDQRAPVQMRVAQVGAAVQEGVDEQDDR